jgi:TPR repeat protein
MTCDKYSQCSLGICYRSMVGEYQRFFEAVRLYRMSTNQGYAIAQYNLCYCYQSGLGGLVKELVEVVLLYGMSAD